uniref:Uncharacterized protein n=1 Tax=Globodera pallida TaxID=36090 RepID=A0A183C3H3_GLOPA
MERTLASSSGPTQPNRSSVRLPNTTNPRQSAGKKEQRDVPPSPAQLRTHQGSPSLQIPAGIRHQSLPRLTQKREHTYGCYSSLLAQALDEGGAGHTPSSLERCFGQTAELHGKAQSISCKSARRMTDYGPIPCVPWQSQ